MIAATCRKHDLRAYDDGFPGDPIFVFLESSGPAGVVRATTFEKAYEVARDLFMDDADPNDASIWKDREHGELEEGYGFRPSGVPTDFDLKSPIYSEDLNCSVLHNVSSPEGRRIVEHYDIVITTEDDEEETEC